MQQELIPTMSSEREVRTMTPYAVIRLLNQRFGTTYPTQMGYNYVRNSLIPARRVDGKWFVETNDAQAWIEKFASKNKLVAVTD